MPESDLHADRLERLTLEALRDLARQHGFSGVSRMRKPELISLLMSLPDKELKNDLPASSDEPLPEPDVRPPLTVDSGLPEPALDPGLPSRRVGGLGVGMASLLRVAGCLGVIVLLVAIIAWPLFLGAVVQRLDPMLDLGATEVRASARSLRLVGDSLHQAGVTLETAATALETTELGLEDSSRVLTSIGLLVGEQAPEALESSRDALIEAQEGARAIDQVLRLLSSLPLIPVQYNPAQTLDDSLGEVAAGIETLPDSLRSSQRDLQDVVEDLGPIRRDLLALSQELETISGSMGEIKGDLDQRAERLDALADSLDRTRERLPLGRNVLILGGVLLLFWMALSQYSVYIVGRELGA